LSAILPSRYIEANNAELLIDTKKPIKNSITSSKQLTERFGQFSLRPPSKDVEQQKKHMNVNIILYLLEGNKHFGTYNKDSGKLICIIFRKIEVSGSFIKENKL